MIKIIFFAALREQLNCDQLTLPAENVNTVEQLKHVLVVQHPHWAAHFENTSLLCAVNHDMVSSEHLLNAGDEVAFFPPVTGG